MGHDHGLMILDGLGVGGSFERNCAPRCISGQERRTCFVVNRNTWGKAVSEDLAEMLVNRIERYASFEFWRPFNRDVDLFRFARFEGDF